MKLFCTTNINCVVLGYGCRGKGDWVGKVDNPTETKLGSK
jgi:hypothetical protein